MPRTAHHRPLSRAEAAPDSRCWRRVRLYDLRYSARAVADTARRPVPRAVRRSVDVHSRARADTHDRSVSVAAALDERRDRQRLRGQLTALRRLVDTPGPGVLALAEADALDVLPARHRRCALWLA
ncbi:hypothetical protein ACFVTT_33120 [Streptomyces niveus]|uniref:hypothetical protein n=1 Tax=Streptomyces niveus TaxID=193462 RepID=UPI00341DB0DE